MKVENWLPHSDKLSTLNFQLSTFNSQFKAVSNQTIYDSFRQTYPEFVYEKYGYDVQPDGLHIVFKFRIGNDICFRPTAFIPSRSFLHFDQPAETMDRLVFNIGMIELVSYWKCYCPPIVRVACGTLDDNQIAFWKKIYFNGLGEFFYTNGISATMGDFMEIENRELKNEKWLPHPDNSQLSTLNSQLSTLNYLVPIGGGKDSVVTLELLTAQDNVHVTPLIMNPRGATIGCVEAARYGMDDVLVIHRSIDPLLLQLNSQGCLNGHTPFSAMLAFYTLLAAQLSGHRRIALSNENSANESTVVGTAVNHQYSKGLEFENDFRQYVAEHLSTGIEYFSFLRPLSELQIAMLFSRFEKYFNIFRSCNAGSRQDVWCGKCAKCLFAYIILSPFIAPARINSIFGKAMLDDMELKPYFDQLIGQAETKPFECVGTIGEVNTALALTLHRWYGDSRPALLQDYAYNPVWNVKLDTLFDEHNLNDEELALLRRYVQAATV